MASDKTKITFDVSVAGLDKLREALRNVGVSAEETARGMRLTAEQVRALTDFPTVYGQPRWMNELMQGSEVGHHRRRIMEAITTPTGRTMREALNVPIQSANAALLQERMQSMADTFDIGGALEKARAEKKKQLAVDVTKLGKIPPVRPVRVRVAEAMKSVKRRRIVVKKKENLE